MKKNYIGNCCNFPILKLLLLAILMLPAGINASAAGFTSDGIAYNILSDADLTVEVTSADREYTGDIVIPSAVTNDSKTYSVTAIGKRAFQSCSNMISVSIPESVTKIGDFAFLSTGLTSINIPESVTSLGENLFSSCKSLETIEVSENNPNYASVDGTLYTKDIETLIECPDAKKGDVTIPESVTTIGNSAFNGCSGLTSVTIPESVTTIGNTAFYGCISLTSVTIPESVTTIDYSAFGSCKGLTSINIPESVTKIGNGAFSNCSSLETIEVSENNPNYVSVDGILYNKDISAIIQCPAGKQGDMTIAESVFRINNSAFSGCSGLTSINIPERMRTFDYGVFFYCTGLTSVYCNWDTPIQCSELFKSNVKQNATLYVPKGTKAAYQEVTPWKDFAHIEEQVSTGVDDIDAAGEVSITVEGGAIRVNGLGIDTAVTVYDYAGRMVYSGKDSVIANLPAGLYIVRVGSVTVKISI